MVAVRLVRGAVPCWPLRAEGESAGKLFLSQVINNCSEDNTGHPAPTNLLCCTQAQWTYVPRTTFRQEWCAAQLEVSLRSILTQSSHAHTITVRLLAAAMCSHSAASLTVLGAGSYLEQYPPAEQLPEDAADGPDVDGVGVVLGAEEDLRRPVVLGHHLLGHVHPPVRLLHSATNATYQTYISVSFYIK